MTDKGQDYTDMRDAIMRLTQLCDDFKPKEMHADMCDIKSKLDVHLHWHKWAERVFVGIISILSALKLGVVKFFVG